MKLRAIKCQMCDCRLQPYAEELVDKRESCDMGNACGLGKWNPKMLPSRPKTIVIVEQSKKKETPALLTTPPKPETPDENIIITISDPLYIHIGKKNNVRYIDPR